MTESGKAPRAVPEPSGPNKAAPLNVHFGRYMLLKRLGAGGMAEAFLAQADGPSGFKKLCVIKRMLPHLAEDEHFVTMFQREARVAAMLTHTNVVQIYELGDVDGACFIAMEYVDGGSVSVVARRAWTRARSVPMEVICCAIADAALGLAAAHELRDADGELLHLVHRDISPDNLMMNREGVTKILDFGVAKIATAEQTATRELKGKMPFLAPEYILGQGLDSRADLYALGVTFYWLVTGKRPFTAVGDLPLMESIVKDTPRPPRKVNPNVPPSIEELILGLLEKDPERRPQTGFIVHDALKDVLSQRRAVVVPFVDEMLKGPPAAAVDPTHQTPGFVPSTPHTDGLKSDWRRRLTASAPKRPAPAAVAPAPDADAPVAALAADAPSPTEAPAPAATGGGDDHTSASTIAPMTAGATEPLAVRAPRRAKPALLAAALALGAVAVAAVVLTRTEEPAPAALVAPGLLPSAAGELPPHPVEPVEAAAIPVVAGTTGTPTSPTSPTDTTSPTDATAPTTPTDEPAVARDRTSKPKGEALHVQARAPASIQWLSERGKALGSGTTALKLTPGAKTVVAVDKKRGGRMSVPINDGVADFGALPHGKIHPRARPFAEVWLGAERLGTTPFAPVDVVVGRYELRFVHEGREERRTVDVGVGEVERPVADFSAAP